MDRVQQLQESTRPESPLNFIATPPTTIILHQASTATPPPSPSSRFTPSPSSRFTPSPNSHRKAGSPATLAARRASSTTPVRSPATPIQIQTHIEEKDLAFFFHAGECKKNPIYLNLVDKTGKPILEEKIYPDDDGFCAINFQGFQSSSAKLPDSKWIISFGEWGDSCEIQEDELASTAIITISKGIHSHIVEWAAKEVLYNIPLLDITESDRANYEIHLLYPHCGWAYKKADLPKDGDHLLLDILPGSTLHLMDKKTNTSVAAHVFTQFDQKTTPGIFFAKEGIPTIKKGYLFPISTLKINCQIGPDTPQTLLDKHLSVYTVGEDGTFKKRIVKATIGYFKGSQELVSSCLSEQGESFALKIDETTYQRVEIPPKTERFIHTFSLTAEPTGVITVKV